MERCTGQQETVVLNYEENMDKMLSCDMSRLTNRGISSVRSRIGLFLAIAAVCLAAGCSGDPLSERFLLGGGITGEICGGQVTLLYSDATYKLMQFSQPQPIGLKAQVLLH